jgi:hypothetical protein
MNKRGFWARMNPKLFGKRPRDEKGPRGPRLDFNNKRDVRRELEREGVVTSGRQWRLWRKRTRREEKGNG